MALGRSDGSVIVDTRVDTDGFGNGISRMQRQVGGLSGSFKKLGLVIAAAFSVKALIDFSRKAIELGSDLQEVQNVVDTVFTTMSEQVNEFAKGAAEAAGLSETMAKRYVGTFGAMAKAFGFAESEAFTMSTALTQLAGDVASFYNITQDEAYTKLKSVFTGETESLKDLGVVMTQAALDSFALAEGLGKTTKQMSEQEKVALRYRFVMNQLSSASGDFLRTSDSWSNQMRVLKLNIESIMATFGQGLINFFTPVIKVINILLSKIATLANAFKALSELIMGKSSGGGGSGASETASGLGELEEGYGGVADGAEDAAEATEKARKANKKYLSGLDEIRTFQSSTEGVGDLSGGGIGGEPIDFGSINTDGEQTNTILDALVEKAKELAEIFKSGFFDGLGDFETRIEIIKEGIESIKNSLVEIFTDPEVMDAANRFVEAFVYALGQLVGAFVSIGLTIAAALIGGLSKYLEENIERIKQYLISMFDIGTEIFNMYGEYASSIAYIFEAFSSENGQTFISNFIGIFASAFMGASELCAQFIRDIINMITKPFIDNKEGFKTALEGYLGSMGEILGTVKDGIDNTFEKLNSVYNESIKPLFDSLAKGLSNITGLLLEFINTHLLPMLSEWAAGFDDLWNNHLQPMADSLAEFFGSIAELVKALWENILQPFIEWFIANILPKILPVINAIHTGVSNVFSAIMDIIKNAINMIKGTIDFVTAIINGDWQGAWNACRNIVESTFEQVLTIIKTVFQGIIDFITISLTTVFSLFDIHLTEIKAFITKIWQDIKKRTSEFLSWVTSNIKGKLNDVKSTWNNIWESLSSKVSSIWDSITSTISSAVSNIKGWIEDLFSLFDKAKEKGSGLNLGFGGGDTRSVNTPNVSSVSIPMLASGTVIPPNAPFMAILGDQKHGTNIEAPLDTIKQAVREVVGNGNGGVLHAHLYLDGREVLTSIIDMAKTEQTSTGINPLLLT